MVGGASYLNDQKHSFLVGCTSYFRYWGLCELSWGWFWSPEKRWAKSKKNLLTINWTGILLFKLFFFFCCTFHTHYSLPILRIICCCTLKRWFNSANPRSRFFWLRVSVFGACSINKSWCGLFFFNSIEEKIESPNNRAFYILKIDSKIYSE